MLRLVRWWRSSAKSQLRYCLTSFRQNPLLRGEPVSAGARHCFHPFGLLDRALHPISSCYPQYSIVVRGLQQMEPHFSRIFIFQDGIQAWSLARTSRSIRAAPPFFSRWAQAVSVAPVVRMSSQRCLYLIQQNDSQNFEHPRVHVSKKNRWILILTPLIFSNSFLTRNFFINCNEVAQIRNS